MNPSVARPTGLLADQAFVALDLETTGLDVRRDRIMQIGAVRLTGFTIAQDETFDRLVDPQMPIPELAERIHGIGAADVAGKPGIAQVIEELAAWIGDGVVIGHSIAFDLAVLRFEAARVGAPWREPRWLDIGLLAAGLDARHVDTSLDDLALAAGIRIEGRHTALGDARAAAEVFVSLSPRLSASGVRSLAQAEVTTRSARELFARQEKAGWFDRPDGKVDFSDRAIKAGASRAIDGFLYQHRLSEVMSSPPRTISQERTLGEAAALMSRSGIGCLLVEPLDAGQAGIVTERDVLRAMGEKGGAAADLPVSSVMSKPVFGASQDTLLYRALGQMARRNLRYLAVTDENGDVCGVFTLRTLLRERALATLTVGDEIAAAASAEDLAAAQFSLCPLAASLLSDGMEAIRIAAVISAETRAMTARAAHLAQEELVAGGRGEAPAPWCLLVLGSGGRGESLLAPDQDNALVIDDAYEGDLDSESDWFTLFAARINEILAQAGIPLCKGGVMARNRPFRRRLAEWREQIDEWASNPEPQALLNVDIFYDFMPAAAGGGDRAQALSARLREAATERARTAMSLSRTMAEQAMQRRAPLNLFGRIRTDDEGRVDLKAGALFPIVAGARAMALRHGVTATATAERLHEATRRAGTGDVDATTLADIHRFVTRLVLAQQIADIQAGRAPSTRVAVKELNDADRDRLREALTHIDVVGEATRAVLAAS
jgi:signal-transduction protein with cAMP-binding, CBS, and nucleotidyltransferase domain/DNA polymerase III epsilon subunit-like protein